MKKNCFIVLTVLLAVMTAACGSAPAATSASAQESTVPDWVDEIAPKDVFWGIGFAKLQNENLAQQTAVSRARRDVAGQLSIMVQGMLTDYAKESGTLDNATSIQSIEAIGRDLINTNLSGAVPNARKRMADGTWWVRVELKKADANKAINDVVNAEAAQYADFKAKEALKMLDQQLDKTQSKPTPRDTD